ncbi:alpha/beta hydrolase [Curtobacterium poinsettiae]|uniref:Alpha/beta hydrolase n=1 Tax=Curtobacterium poinsettiae TaxID=159612 RepID=A0ABT3S1G4_9MICO|nr:alpha/beta hydrolase [Curtobacterium flaccumfaciens]MBT1609008.1 alpha/beta hydrolase family protein [Curtobacterium flaccumfaciens pv. poinsettiae]MCX2848074.1 alpha/beta hydrolase [Curtobacterium flaccumfaciens pv. poinsettiae]UXN18677.1 alpha/beta hydrolase family protein [Curtobacterium flaccumfaciens pv. poinsettiae]
MSADPVAGDPDGIQRIARRHEDRSDAVRDGARHVLVAAEHAASGWAGRAQQQFLVAAAAMPASAHRVAARLDAASAALATYARQVREIQDDAASLQTTRRNTADDIAANDRAIRDATAVASGPDAVESDRALLQQLQHSGEWLAGLDARLSAQWDELVARRAAADRAAAAALEDRSVLGKLVSAAVVSAMSDGQFLTWLGTLDPESIAALGGDLRVAKRLAGIDAAQVAGWWQAMSGVDGAPSAAQRAFVAAMPAVIGNLNGVASWARARANTTVLADRLAHARRQVRHWRELHDAARNPADAAAAREQLLVWERQRDAYRNIQDTLATTPVSLVALVDDRPPLAQIVAGDLDRATHVSVIVPGMNTATYQDGTVQDYSAIAIGMRAEQVRVSGARAGDVAVLSWIGYHPPMADDPSFRTVLADDRAQAGAGRLVADLDGFHAARAAAGRDADLTVMGHSYGTTVATIALTKTHADHVVLLGSAGVTDAAPKASALHVPEGQVFATQGAKDGWAVTGQNLSGRRDPTESTWDAHEFSSETEGRGSDTRHGITRHGPYDGDDDDGRYSYFDNGTTAQYNAARAAMGLGDEIPERGGPFDRMRQQTKDDWLMYGWQTGGTGDPML